MKMLLIDREISMVGSCVVMANAAVYLAKRGNNVKLAGMFTSKGHPSLRGVTVVVPSPSIQKILKSNKLFLTFFGPLFLLVKTVKEAFWADVLVSASYPTHWIAVIASVLSGKPVVWNCFEPWIYFSWRDAKHVGFITYSAGWLARSPLDHLFVLRIKGIFVLDEKNQKRVFRLYQRKAIVIRPGVDYAYFSKGDKKRAQKKWGIGEKHFVITCAASLSPMKNQIVLLLAIARIKKYVPEVLLLLVGEGPMRQLLARQAARFGIASHVRFLGQVAPVELRHLYAASNLLAFPAVCQTWGLTPFEAACVGTPAIISSDCGASEVIKKERIGLACLPQKEAFAHAILHCYKNPALRSDMGKRARLYASRTTWSQYASAIEMFIKKTL